MRRAYWLVGCASVILAEFTEVAKLKASDEAADDYIYGYGGAVAAWGNTLVIGAQNDGEAGYLAGAVYVVKKDGSTFTEVQ